MFKIFYISVDDSLGGFSQRLFIKEDLLFFVILEVLSPLLHSHSLDSIVECFVELRKSFDNHDNVLEFTKTYEVSRFFSGADPLENE